MKKIESRKKFQLKNNNNLFVVSIFLCVWKNCKTLSVSDQIVHGSATLKKINRSNISWPCFLKANYGDGFQNMEQSLSSFQPTYKSCTIECACVCACVTQPENPWPQCGSSDSLFPVSNRLLGTRRMTGKRHW